MKISQVVRLLNSDMAAKYTDVASCTWGAQRGGGPSRLGMGKQRSRYTSQLC
jgi:hypothetical protein